MTLNKSLKSHDDLLITVTTGTSISMFSCDRREICDILKGKLISSLKIIKLKFRSHCFSIVVVKSL